MRREAASPARVRSRQGAFKFRQGAEKVENEQALRGRSVEGFRQAAKSDIAETQGLDCFDGRDKARESY
jgi:hypothetical protein